MLAYLKTIDNGRDDLAVKRIINVPKRGIGATTINKVQAYADANMMSFYDALKIAEDIPGLGRSAAKIRPFVTFIQSLRSKLHIISLEELMNEIIEDTGYVTELKLEGTDEADAEWLMLLHTYGLLKASFQPERFFGGSCPCGRYRFL